MSIRERALDLLFERSPRSPDELATILDCPPSEIIAALSRSSWDAERCAPPPGERCWWWTVTLFGRAARDARAQEPPGRVLAAGDWD